MSVLLPRLVPGDRTRLGQTSFDCHAHQLTGMPNAKLHFYLSQVIRDGLVAKAQCAGDRGKIASPSKQTQDLKLASG